ncbi:hypothetical protein PV963_00450 [Streptomyces coeruleorubidus]|uniref:hypothetical protein n=1 Tax=Streptomyces coeruleorubidus TaxID=116188 RepID=UPI00237FBA2B|nr:hypothetical protein [Streptomyces coeruleorubidus]WDV49108.1 hypothetical protein PV963_00450 [Streptomyces coeruleorubidus]
MLARTRTPYILLRAEPATTSMDLPDGRTLLPTAARADHVRAGPALVTPAWHGSPRHEGPPVNKLPYALLTAWPWRRPPRPQALAPAKAEYGAKSWETG